jgi:predicted RNA-binding protein with RPS1 domain
MACFLNQINNILDIDDNVAIKLVCLDNRDMSSYNLKKSLGGRYDKG